MARELGPRNVTVNVVMPGPVATDLLKGQEAAAQQLVDNHVPSKRFGTPEEISAVLEFLTSRDAGYVTGAVIPVDGGLTMGR